MQCGIKRSAGADSSGILSQAPLGEIANANNSATLPLPPTKKTALDQFETNTTKKLSTKELQRLVLLQQLKTAEVQEEYFKQKLILLKEKLADDTQNNIVQEGGCSYYNI